MRKTGNIVEIPIMPPLKEYLQQIKSAQAVAEDYVLPEHAKMYLSNASGISYRIKQFLEKDCGITTIFRPGSRLLTETLISVVIPARCTVINVRGDSLSTTIRYFGIIPSGYGIPYTEI